LVRAAGPSALLKLPTAGIKNHLYAVASCSTAVAPDTTSKPSKVNASCCGFPKDLNGGPSFILEHGVFGEDACFISKYKSTHVAGIIENHTYFTVYV
jgi:hypothetical protein